MKRTLLIVFTGFFNLLSIIIAQPSFPSEPNQAPIGGLGLLAATGGAMALKKLRDKKMKK